MKTKVGRPGVAALAIPMVVWLLGCEAGVRREYVVYLAGPDVFLSDPGAKEAGRRKVAAFANVDPEGQASFTLKAIYPYDNAVPDFRNDPETAKRIFDANIAMMESADLVVANMIPFRGPSMDVGTAFEMGFMLGSGKPVFGYYDESGFPDSPSTPAPELSYIARVRRAFRLPQEATQHPRGVDIEDFGLADNLMLVAAVERTGCPIASSFDEVVGFVRTYLTARERGDVEIRCGLEGTSRIVAELPEGAVVGRLRHFTGLLPTRGGTGPPRLIYGLV